MLQGSSLHHSHNFDYPVNMSQTALYCLFNGVLRCKRTRQIDMSPWLGLFPPILIETLSFHRKWPMKGPLE